MRFYRSCILGLLVSPVALAAAGTSLPPSVESGFAAYTRLPSILVPVLQQAQDKESATNAAKELQKKFPAIYEARERIQAIPQLTPEQDQQVRQQFGQKMREEWARMYFEIERIRQNRCFQSEDMRNAFRLMCLIIEK